MSADFQINIMTTTKNDPTTNLAMDGFQISMIGQTGKRETNERDFFAADSEIGIRIKRLKKDLRDYFDANP